MKNFILLLFSIISLSVFSQEESQVRKLIILDSRFNGTDVTDWSFDNGNYLMLYTDQSDNLCLTNITNFGQSYGQLITLDAKAYPETKEKYYTEVYKFRWKYYNTYDKHNGSSLIKLILINKPNAVIFELKMLHENTDTGVYKGYLE